MSSSVQVRPAKGAPAEPHRATARPYPPSSITPLLRSSFPGPCQVLLKEEATGPGISAAGICRSRAHHRTMVVESRSPGQRDQWLPDAQLGALKRPSSRVQARPPPYYRG